MKKIIKIIFLVFLLAFIAIQFVPNELPSNSDDLSTDLIEIENPPAKVQAILRTACYDCHSNETRYPWYSHIAPVSWLVARDIELGREELNFSNWAEQSKRRKIKILTEMTEEIEKKEMPLEVYTIVHRDAILTDEEIQEIADWSHSVTKHILGD